MFSYFKRKNKEEVSTRKLSNSILIESGTFLLRRQSDKIFDIKQSLSITEDLYQKLYFDMFKSVSVIAQCVPGSENHHHNHKYGYLDHIMECVVLALRLREGFIYRSDQEDLISKKKDVFTYAVVVASLCHDLGKLVTDIEFFNVNSQKVHNVIFDNMDVGTEFIYRFYPQRKIEDHKCAGLLLLHKVVPMEGINWLMKEESLYRELIHSLSGNYPLANKLGEIVITADRHSTSTNISLVSEKHASSNSATNSISSDIFNRLDITTTTKSASQINMNSKAVGLIDALIVCLKNPESYSRGKGLNIKGSFAWVTKEYIYVVHPKCFNLIESVLDSIQSKIKISQAMVCYAILNDAGFIDQVNNQHYSYFNLADDSWSANLPMIKFYRNKLDPNYELHETSIVIKSPEELSVKNSVVNDTEDTGASQTLPVLENNTTIAETIHNSDTETTSNLHKETVKINKEVDINFRTNDSPPLDAYDDMQEPTDSEEFHDYSSSNELSDLIKTEVGSNEKVVKKQSQKNINQVNLFKDSFISFITKSLKIKELKFNKNGAPIHLVDNKLCLVSPSIFKLYIKNVGKENVCGILNVSIDISVTKLVKQCQYELFKLDMHHKDISLKNILRFSVVGKNKKSFIYGILINNEVSVDILGHEMNNSRNVFLVDIIS